MKISDILSSDDKWTRNAFARDRYGEACDAQADGAVCWCLEGAMDKAEYPEECYQDIRNAMYALFPSRMAQYNDREVEVVSSFNDDPLTTFGDIRRVLKQAGH